MGMGMKSLKCEGIGTKNLFPHTSNANEFSSTSCMIYTCVAGALWDPSFANRVTQIVQIRGVGLDFGGELKKR